MKRFYLFSLAGIVLSSIINYPAFSQTTNETLTITTYYPSPYGVYNELRLYPKSVLLPGDCTELNEGTMYYDNTNNRLMVCAETGFGIYGWQSTSSLWTLSSSGTNLYPNNDTWNVGIGTTSPGAKLHIVNGELLLGAEGAAPEGGQLELQGTGAAPVSFFLDNYDNRFRIHSSGFERMTVTNAGNVGIGTTSPAEKLEVAGNVKLTGAAATYKITNVANPTAAQDVATKAYVDAQATTIVAFRYTDAACPVVTGATLRFVVQNGGWGGGLGVYSAYAWWLGGPGACFYSSD